MANNGNGANNVNLTPQLQEQLVKIAGTVYSVNGYAPSKSGWDLTPDQICSIIKHWTRGYLKDVSDVTLDINHKTGAIYAFVWIPSNSNHICNRELEGNNSAINRSLTKFSSELKEFMDKFCSKEDRRIISEERNLPLAGIRVQIDRFIKLEFDENSYEFGKLFGEKYKRKTKIKLTCNFQKATDGKFGKLLHVEVIKMVKSNFNNWSPKPKRSYNAR